jgi:DNA polymerase III alpha subunit
MVAVINNFGGFYSTEFYIHEAQRYGAIIEAPEINESEYLTRIEGNVICLGWIHIKSLESKLVESFLQERNFGYVTSFSNFVSRISIGLEQLIILIRVGAFRIFGTPKKELLWEAHFRYIRRFQSSNYKQTLFGCPEPETHHLPALVYHPLEDAYDQIELMGFSISSPFELVAAKNTTSTTSKNLIRLVGRNIRIYGYLVTWKPVRTKNHKLMGFGYFLD